MQPNSLLGITMDLDSRRHTLIAGTHATSTETASLLG
jgi:hypothetical protein